MGSGPPPLPNQVVLLEGILARIVECQTDGARAPLVVFDLDATLFDNRPRTLQILSEYASEVVGEYPDVAEALQSLRIDTIRYLLTDTLRGCGIAHADIVRDVTSYWRHRFFADEYIRYDDPTPGAADYVRFCYDAGAVIVYLTGRDIPAMLLGTAASLRDTGFPIGVAGTEMILKPDAGMGDEAFKRGALPTLSRVGDVIAFFDNEPANCNLARQLNSDAIVVLVDTQSVPGAPPPVPGIEMISDFRFR